MVQNEQDAWDLAQEGAYRQRRGMCEGPVVAYSERVLYTPLLNEIPPGGRNFVRYSHKS
jgi:hypothetical protein